ncbi:C6 finger domain protein [Aspergillus sp. HF37]|nr:C6 finger domain protein [Aspergillus sp. HF37]
MFANSADRTTKADEGDEDEQDMTYRDAEREWEDVLAAFDTFAYGLGRDFLPLPPDTTPPISTPFGQALQYRTDTIAAIWGFYYAGRTILHRFHPSMPPAMMVAAGVAAPTTAEYGQVIGRIAGGIYYPQRYNFQAGSLNPNMGSCLVELTVPIYFSAVQYTDTTQRRWIVTQMHEVSRLTGWESANIMVRGCESAWIVAAKQGRGPPYERLYQYGDQNTPFNASQKREEDGAQQEGNSERRFVAISNASRKHWAMGILSLEDDVLNLDIEDRR